MVQYGFPVPSELPLERPLCDSDALVRENIAAEQKAVAAAAAEARQPEEGVEAEGGFAGDLPTGAEGNEQEDAGWGEERVRLMNDLFMRAQERFAREAAGDERQFEIRVSLSGCVWVFRSCSAWAVILSVERRKEE